MSLRVDAQPIGVKFHRLMIYHDGQLIGEYERSQAADIARKTREIEKALPKLLEIYRTRGEFQVRWDGRNNAKSVRVNGVEVWKIPRECWETPSWEQ
jgi:hypothetical protein